MKRLLAVLLLAGSAWLPATASMAAQDKKTDEQALESKPPLTEEERARAQESPLELEPLEVTSENWSLNQEFTLRLLRGALGHPKSHNWEDRNVWICWIEDATGSHLSYLNCARNGDLWALERPFGLQGPTVPMGGYGTILRSSHPVNRYKLKQTLASLPGDKQLDREFVNRVIAGEDAPRDIPTDAELDEFTRAYQSIGELLKSGASEERQIAAIKSAGLTLERYNRIADLLEIYASLRNDVAERLKALK